jgi:hypothetical protein
MKKILFLLVTLTTLTNVSYASFPVTEDLKAEIIEEVVANTETPRRQGTCICNIKCSGSFFWRFYGCHNFCSSIWRK